MKQIKRVLIRWDKFGEYIYSNTLNKWISIKTFNLQFDNSNGGVWSKYISVPLTTAPLNDEVYMIVITNSSFEIYAGDHTQIITDTTSGAYSDFWGSVDNYGNAIRVFDETYSQIYFWVEKFDYTNKECVLWVKLLSGTNELNIAYDNSSATKSDYCDGTQVFELFDDFNSLDTSVWGTSGSPAVASSILTVPANSYVYSLSNFGVGYTLRTFAEYYDSSNNQWVGFEETGYHNTGTNDYLSNIDTDTVNKVHRVISGNTSGNVSKDLNEFYSGYHIFEITRLESATVYYIDDTSVYNDTQYYSTTLRHVILTGWTSGMLYIDWVAVIATAHSAEFVEPVIKEM